MKNSSRRGLKRKRGGRSVNSRICIITEGKKTEPNYFNSKKKEVEEEVRRRGIEVEVTGTGRNTVSIVDFALKYIKNNGINLDIDECWVVFDKDSFDKDFDKAIEKAELNGIKVAYSNESFELWFLLHFDPLFSDLHRKILNQKLDKKIKEISGQEYQKNSKDIYGMIKHLEEDAIKNAKRLLKMHKGEKSCLLKKPSTTVHLLVEALNNFK